MTELELQLQAELEQEQKLNRELYRQLESRERLYSQELKKISDEHTKALQAILGAMQKELSSAASSASDNGLERSLNSLERRLSALEEKQSAAQRENADFMQKFKTSWNGLMEDVYGKR
jgi:hypothetical protein